MTAFQRCAILFLVAVQAVSLAAQPTDVPVKTRYEVLRQAKEQIAAHHLGDAEGTLTRILETDPDEARAIELMGVIRVEQGKNEEAEALFRKAIARQPGLAAAHANLGAEFSRSIELAPQQTASYAELGDIEAAAGNGAAAKELYEKALEHDPRQVTALTGLGVLNYRAKAYAEAENYLARAVAAAPQYQTAHYYRGLTLAPWPRGRIEDRTCACDRSGSSGPPAASALVSCSRA